MLLPGSAGPVPPAQTSECPAPPRCSSELSLCAAAPASDPPRTPEVHRTQLLQNCCLSDPLIQVFLLDQAVKRHKKENYTLGYIFYQINHYITSHLADAFIQSAFDQEDTNLKKTESYKYIRFHRATTFQVLLNWL